MGYKNDWWSIVGNGCLEWAAQLLNTETTPTEETVEMVSRLVNIAISIDTLNLHWEAQSQNDMAHLQDNYR